MRQRVPTLVLSLALALGLAWLCGSAAAARHAGSPKPKRGGTFTLVHTGDTPGFDPILLNGSITGDGNLTYPVFDMLLLQNPVTGAIEPKIATSLTSKDGTNYTLKLRPGVKFTDGTPYNAAAVMFNWTRAQQPNNTSSSLTYANAIASMKVVNATTFSFTLKAKDPQFPIAVATTALGMIGSPKAIQDEGANFATHPVGAGPFILTNWTRGSSASYDRNPNYWDKPRPYFDHLQILVSAVGSTRTNDYLAKTVEAASLLIPSQIRQARIAVPGTVVFLRDGNIGSPIMMFNEKKPPFTSMLARQAIAYAMNVPGYAASAQIGAAPKYMIRKPSPFYDPKAPISPTYDPAKAQQLLDQYAAQNGGPLTFKLTTTTLQPAIADYFVSQLSSFKNLKVTADLIDITQLAKKYVSGDWNFGLSLIGRVPAPGYAFYNPLLSTSPANLSGYSDPTMDAALKAGVLAAPGSPTQIKAYQTVQATINKDIPLVWLPLSGGGDVVSSNIGGRILTNRNGVSWLFERMWFK
jgi:peptide/nickel transport system substrate-binding protein